MHVAIDADVLRTHHERGDKVESRHHGKHHGKSLEEAAAPETPAAVVEIGEDGEESEGTSVDSGHGNAVSRAVAAARAAARAAGEKLGPAVSHAARLANGSLHEIADEPEPDEAEDVEGPVPAPAPLPEETTDPDGTTGVPVTDPSGIPVADTPAEPVADPAVTPSTDVPVESVTVPVAPGSAVDVTSSSTSIHLSVFSLNLTFASFTFGNELNVQA